VSRAATRPAHLQAVLDRYQADRRLPSVVAGVLEGGRLSWTGTAGAATSSDTQHRIGSITKTITALVVMGLRDDGLLSLDDELGRHVPESGGYARATLRELLSHTSGMQSEPAGTWWERSPGGSFEELVAANDGSGAVFGAGETYHYSNLGFALLGEVASRAVGRPWADLVADRVLGPLRMSRTSYLPQAPHAQGLSVDHLRGTLTEEPHHDTGAMAPAGQLWSTVEDLALLAGMLAGNPSHVLAEPSLAEMRRQHADGYGLGLRLVPYADGVLVGHNGSMPGFQATVLVDPRRGSGVVALTNATTGFAGEELALALLGDHTPGPVPAWVPTDDVPEWAEPLLGLWHWGNSAYESRWQNGLLEWRDLARGYKLAEQFAWVDGRVVGVAGYHHGETLHVGEDRLECATFVYTRTPYPDGP
jgi:CubicO group peptidase (beta-lactamase class C family)